MPLWNYAFNQGGPDPDYVYSTAEIDPHGVYRISGYRGTSRFVEITQQGFDMMTASRTIGRRVTLNAITHDLDDLTIDDDGYFSVVLSRRTARRPRRRLVGAARPERPAAADAAVLVRLEPRDRRAASRSTGSTTGGADMTPEEIARRFSELADVDRGHDRVRHGARPLLPRAPRRQHVPALEQDRRDGRAADQQAYYDGIHEIDDDEALILETPLPAECRYWQALVADDRFCTVDWVNRQSSLNDAQAHIDSDGWFRAVISKHDPGVPNWLDKADYPWGIIQMRLYRANDYPDPTIKKVPVADVREHLPADTPVVTPEERAAQLRHRRTGAQLRRIW